MKNDKHGLFSKKEWIGIAIGLTACFTLTVFCSSCFSCTCLGSGGNINGIRLIAGVCDSLMEVLASFGK